MIQFVATLTDRRHLGATVELRLQAPEAAAWGPGQPILVRAGPGIHPYLRRTFLPVALEADALWVRLPPDGDLGHAMLRTAPAGAPLDCLGPVGNGYSVPPGVRNLLCIGEGEAAWALLPAVEVAERRGLAVTMAAESRTTRELIPAGRLPAAAEYVVGTREAGNVGLGPAVEAPLRWADLVLAAGSLQFYSRLAAAAGAARYGALAGFVQALYPATFLCGSGACQACAVDVAGGRRRVCLRGPVFDLTDLTGMQAGLR
jgi:dihydroorotate dehydrogenase electron transfer subunit